MTTHPLPDLATLRGGRFLVTGGAGTIGSEIVDQLLAAGAEHVTILDNLVRGRRANIAEALATGRVRLVEGDIRDRALVDELVNDPQGLHTVFHQAAIRITQCAEDPRLAVDVMVNGTFTVLEAVAAVGNSDSAGAPGRRMPKVVAASSASVYGMGEQFPTTERHHPYNNDTIYGAAKTFNEGMLASFRAMYGLDYVALRYFNVYGPRMDVHGKYTEVLVRWMERIDDGLPPLIFGDGSQTMDFVVAEDIARANLLAAASSIPEGVYNVASGHETSLQQLAEALLRVMDSELPIDYGPERAVNSVVRRLADISAAERDLGFRARIGLDEGLRQLVQWWRPLREEVAAGRDLMPSSGVPAAR